MQANIHQQVHFLGSPTRKLASSKQASEKGMQKAAFLGLIRIAGNMFECPSTKDLWKVNGDKVIRLSSTEVDFNEKLTPADSDDPKGYLAGLLAELEF
jgi:hypothetical protein